MDKGALEVKLGFTGTQTGMTPAQRLAAFDEVTALSPRQADHGLCIGFDEEIHEMLRAYFVEVEIHGHPPLNTWKMAVCDCDVLHPPKEYLPRNRDIVDATEWLVAGPKGPEEHRSGTWSTVRYARRLGRPVSIVWPDGTVTRERAPTPSSPHSRD